jgi:hypothetical protein
MLKPAYYLIIDAACPKKTILRVAVGHCRGPSNLRSLVGGVVSSIPSDKKICEAGAKGFPCRGGLFDVVNADVVGLPNDADPCEFLNSLLEDPVLAARYEHLIESASKSFSAIRLENLCAANERRSHGKVKLTIGRKTRVFETLQELHHLNIDPNKVIHLPNGVHRTMGSVAEQIFNAQLANPTLGLVREASKGYHGAYRLIEYPAFSLKFLDMDRAAAACAYNAAVKKSSQKSSKATKKAPAPSMLDHFKPAAPATEKKSSQKSSKATKKAPAPSMLDHFKPAAPATEKKSSQKSSKATKKAPAPSILDHFKPAAPKRNASEMTESDSDSDWSASSD